jgi:hypothetical protein
MTKMKLIYKYFKGPFKDLSFLHKIYMRVPATGDYHPSEINLAYSG